MGPVLSRLGDAAVAGVAELRGGAVLSALILIVWVLLELGKFRRRWFGIALARLFGTSATAWSVSPTS